MIEKSRDVKVGFFLGDIVFFWYLIMDGGYFDYYIEFYLNDIVVI